VDRNGTRADREILLIVLVSCVAFAVVLIRNAWVSDEAYVAFRSIDNLLGGHGLAWNPGERVQTFTAPAWVLLMSGLRILTGDLYYTSIVACLVLTLACFLVLALRAATSAQGVLLAACVMVFSKAFVDHSVSGTGSPLLSLSLVLFLLAFARRMRGDRSLVPMGLAASVGIMCSLETLVLFLPPILWALFENRTRRALLHLLVGLVPLLAWMGFALLYYGFLLPNPTVARLEAGLPAAELAEQGLYYLVDSLLHDPITLLVVLCGLCMPLVTRKRGDQVVGLGLLVYLVHVVRTGGSDESGLLLTPALVVALVLVVRQAWTAAPAAWLVILVAGLVGYAAPLNPVRSDGAYKNTEQYNGIRDARGATYLATGLLTTSRHLSPPRGHEDVSRAEKARAAAGSGQGVHLVVSREPEVGLFGFHAGPAVHVIDEIGRTDPLLARLPMSRDPGWVVGRERRVVPDGYTQTLVTGETGLVDGALGRYHEELSHITRGPLLSPRRLLAIVRMNLGLADRLLDRESYQYPDREVIELEQVSRPLPEGTPWNGKGTTRIGASGLEILLGRRVHATRIQIGLDHNDAYRITFALGLVSLGSVLAPVMKTADGGLVTRLVDVPADVAESGYDRIIVLPRTGDGRCSLGHVLLVRPEP
jgi:arabinofuranosyltransferase